VKEKVSEKVDEKQVNVKVDDVNGKSNDEAAKIELQTGEKTSPVYAFECKTSRSFQKKEFSEEELIALHSDVCKEETREWNKHHSLQENTSTLKFVVDSSNFQNNEIEKASSLMVRAFVLQPFESCNRRTTICAALNLLENSNIVLKPGIKFWDLKTQIDSLEKDQSMGTYNKEKNELELSSASAENSAIKQVASWISQNTEQKIKDPKFKFNRIKQASL